jgi:hypothetical protein
MIQETNPRLKSVWERFLDYELGQLHLVRELFKEHERRDPAEVLPEELPEPIKYESHREFVRKVLSDEVDLRTSGPLFVDPTNESPASVEYRRQMNSQGSPSESVAEGYVWHPGTELRKKAVGKK